MIGVKNSLMTRAQRTCGEGRKVVLVGVWDGCPVAGAYVQSAPLAEGVCYVLSAHPDEFSDGPASLPVLQTFCWHPNLTVQEMDLFEHLANDVTRSDSSVDVLSVVRALSEKAGS